jgi:pimeloyl-ACP methyl ester carboxylesterase
VLRSGVRRWEDAGVNRQPGTLVLLLVLLLGACVEDGGSSDPADLQGDGGIAGEAGPSDLAAGQVGLADPEIQRDDCPAALTAALAEPAADGGLGGDEAAGPQPPDAACGYLIVPEDRTAPTGPVVEVAFAHLPARPTDDPPTRRPPPLLVLPDGPGVGGLEGAAAWVGSALRDEREVLLLDPRGTGRSFPALDCGEPARPGVPPPDVVADCRRLLAAQGVDVRAYATGAIAADVADLVRALELDRVDVLGTGAGGRVALEVLRQGRVAVRALVLDSTAPPDVDVVGEGVEAAEDALDRLAAACAERGRCGEDLLDAAGAALADLERRPAEGLAAGVVAALRGRAGAEAVLDALRHLAVGEADEAAAALQAAPQGAGHGFDGEPPAPDTPAMVSEGAALAVRCRDEAADAGTPPEDAGRTPFGRAVAADLRRLLEACTAWPTAAPGPGADRPVETGEAFVLALAGELDPLVAPRHADRLADGDRAQSLVLPGIGHGVHDADDCATGIVAAFLLRPGAVLDASCAEVD